MKSLFNTTTVTFINRPNDDGTVTDQIIANGCLIAQNGSPTALRPQVLIHLPKSFKEKVDGAWVKIEGNDYHVIGTKIGEMEANTPTPFNRYAIAEQVY